MSLFLGALHKIFVDGCTHLKSLVIGQVEFLCTVMLAPVLKPVALDLPQVDLPKLINLLLSIHPYTVFVQPVELSVVVVKVQ